MRGSASAICQLAEADRSAVQTTFMKKIKILHIIPSLLPGGAEKMAALLAEFSNPEKFSIGILCLKAGGLWEEKLIKQGIPVTIVGSLNRPIIFDFFKIVKAIKNFSPDIVHTHLFGGDFYGRICARLAGVKKIISTEQNVNFSEGKLRKLAKFLTSLLAIRIVAASKAIKKYLIADEGVAPEKIEVIYNGVETDKFSPLARDYKPSGRPLVVGSIGRLTEQKGFDYLLEALAKIKEVECLIAGEGEEKENLEKKIKMLGLDRRVKLVGLQKDVPQFLRSLDVFVLPSRWEGFGIVLLEAGLSGLPIIASRVDGILEIIEDGLNGWLFEKGNVEELADKLKKILAEPAARARLGKNIREKVLDKFEIKKIVKQYEDLYLKILT